MMACRDCEWWGVPGEAEWKACCVIEKTMPEWFIHSLHSELVLTSRMTRSSDGTDCPAFKASEGE